MTPSEQRISVWVGTTPVETVAREVERLRLKASLVDAMPTHGLIQLAAASLRREVWSTVPDWLDKCAEFARENGQ